MIDLKSVSKLAKSLVISGAVAITTVQDFCFAAVTYRNTF